MGLLGENYSAYSFASRDTFLKCVEFFFYYKVDRCQVIQVKTKAKDGIDALQIGAGQKNLKRLKKPEIGHYLKVGVPPKESVCEFKISPENALPPGKQ